MKIKYDDKWHSYYFDNDDGKGSKRITGVSTVAKLPDDTTQLEKWKMRQVALGMALRKDLIEQASINYDDKQMLNDIAYKAMNAAGGDKAADAGTLRHKIIERYELGEHIIETDLTKSTIAAWTKAKKAHGIEIVESERIVVHPTLAIAGRFDHLVKLRKGGKIGVLDLKTGARALEYPHAIAIQLACYANAPLMAARLDGPSGETEVFEKLPEKMDRKWAYVVHMPVDGSDIGLVKVDIDAGWQAAQHAIALLKWRKRDDLVVPLGGVPVVETTAPASDERSHWIKARLELIKLTDNGVALVRSTWPAGVSGRGPWTEADIDAIDEVLAKAERASQAPFGDLDPAGSAAQSA